ncbi:hypothetical protein D3C73_386690 [compost metagenome]
MSWALSSVVRLPVPGDCVISWLCDRQQTPFCGARRYGFRCLQGRSISRLTTGQLFPDAQGCHRLPGRPCPVCTILPSRHISMASVRWGISIALRSRLEGRMWRPAGRSSPYAGSSICAGRSAIVFARLRRVMPVPSPPPLSPMRDGQFPKIQSRRYGSPASLTSLPFPD